MRADEQILKGIEEDIKKRPKSSEKVFLFAIVELLIDIRKKLMEDNK